MSDPSRRSLCVQCGWPLPHCYCAAAASAQAGQAGPPMQPPTTGVPPQTYAIQPTQHPQHHPQAIQYVHPYPNYPHYQFPPPNSYYPPVIQPGPPLQFVSGLQDTTNKTRSKRAAPLDENDPNKKKKRKTTRKAAPPPFQVGSGVPAATPSAPSAASAPSSTSAASAPVRTPPTSNVIPGIGPSPSAPNPVAVNPSLSALGSLTAKPKDPNAKASSASDVWYFIRPLHNDKAPETTPVDGVPSLKPYDKAQYSHLGCKLCTNKWQVWKNADGQTKTIREHLRTHGHDWENVVLDKQLKGWESVREKVQADPSLPRPAFSLDGFYSRLVNWVVGDDQSLNVVESPRLRELLLYLCPTLRDADLPHRTKLGNLIVQRFQEEYTAMIERLRKSLGRIALTSDISSRVSLQGFLAVTAHYAAYDVKGNLVIRSELIAFRHISGSHTGKHIADIIMQIAKDAGILHKLSAITLDNASNNNTCMVEVAQHLKGFDISFDAEANRIRCFPHVINIAVKTALDALSKPPDLEVFTTNAAVSDSEKVAYWTALKNDVVRAARTLVSYVRASGERREDFEATIRNGNKNGGWGSPDPVILRVVILLRDVDTRWSSTFLMIDRLLELHLAVQQFLHDKQNDDFLSGIQIKALTDIRRFLYFPHTMQEILSAEKTPTLALVLPLYEKLIMYLDKLKTELPQLEHAIEAAIEKLREYMGYARTSPLYVLAMVINPTIKFSWIEKNWGRNDYVSSREIVRTAMLQFARDGGAAPSSQRTTSAPRATPAAQAQRRGLALLSSLASSFSDNSSTPASASVPSPSVSIPNFDEIVDKELAKFEEEAVIQDDDPEMEDFDLCAYWKLKRAKFPLLYRIALDVLPIQASAVPCERVFSSMKETDTLRRSRLKPVLFEKLQIMKFMLRNDLMDFTYGLERTEIQNDEIVDVLREPPGCDALTADKNLSELFDIIDESHDHDDTFTFLDGVNMVFDDYSTN